MRVALMALPRPSTWLALCAWPCSCVCVLGYSLRSAQGLILPSALPGGVVVTVAPALAIVGVLLWGVVFVGVCALRPCLCSEGNGACAGGTPLG